MEHNPTLNVALLERTLAFLEANPHRWDQSRFATVDGRACFGGWAVVLHESVPLRALFTVPGFIVAWRAQRALGLNEGQALAIFGYVCTREHCTSAEPCVQPTFQQLCDRISEETGFCYDPRGNPPVVDALPVRELVAA